MNKSACVQWSVGKVKGPVKSTLAFCTLAVRGFCFKRHLWPFILSNVANSCAIYMGDVMFL